MNKIVFIVVALGMAFCIYPTSVAAQWVQTYGPQGGIINCFAVSGTQLFAGTAGSGVFLSTNNGTTWTAVNAGLTDLRIYALVMYKSLSVVWLRPLFFHRQRRNLDRGK